MSFQKINLKGTKPNNMPRASKKRGGRATYSEVSHHTVAILVAIDENEFKTLDDLKAAIEQYIKWYNEKRISLKRKGLSPLEYRQQSLSQL